MAYQIPFNGWWLDTHTHTHILIRKLWRIKRAIAGASWHTSFWHFARARAIDGDTYRSRYCTIRHDSRLLDRIGHTFPHQIEHCDDGITWILAHVSESTARYGMPSLNMTLKHEHSPKCRRNNSGTYRKAARLRSTEFINPTSIDWCFVYRCHSVIDFR